MSEVSEIQASSELVQALQKSKLLDDLYANPKTKGQLLSILKEQRPDLSIPEIDGPKAMKDALAPEMVEIARTRDELRGEVARLNIMRKHNLSDDELVMLANDMKEKGITKIDTAIELRKLSAHATPRNSPSTPLQLPDAKELFSNPREWARNEAYKTINDLHRGRNNT